MKTISERKLKLKEQLDFRATYKILYMWVKQGQISSYEFSILMDYIYSPKGCNYSYEDE